MKDSKSIQNGREGRVFAIENFATVDGPGIRSVIFLQGCFLRCLYCHNPEARQKNGGQLKSAEEVLEEVLIYKNYWDYSGGGITLSGGEPLYQSGFCLELTKLAKEHDIHVTIDTSGGVPWEKAKPVLELADLALLDIKGANKFQAEKMASLNFDVWLKFLDGLNSTDTPVWARYVLVPGINDSEETLHQVADIANKIRNRGRFEILPFHQYAKDKYHALDVPYTLREFREAGPEDINMALEVFRKYGLDAIY